MKNIKVILLLSLLLGLGSCTESTLPPEDLGYDYFPFTTGRYVDYAVDSLVFDIPSDVRDTFQFQVRERIGEKFTDNQGREAARLERYYRDNDTSTWELRDVWVINREARTAEKVEENERYVKLVFPIEESITWDGNAQNVRDEWSYKYTDIELAKTIGAETFNNTIQVIQIDDTTLIGRDYATEIYALGIGMVYKQVDTLEYDFGADLRTGIKYRMQAIGYGEN